MKKIIFTLLTVFALAFFANSVKAQTAITPYIGETYSYTLSGITVINASTAVVTYSGTNVTLPSGISISAGADQSISFDVTYDTGATAGNLTVTITDGTTNCSNYINLAIAPTAAPTIAVAVTSSVDDLCQNTDGTLNDNESADIGASANTFTFTVTPTITGSLAADATYSFDFDLNDYLIDANPITIQYTSGSGTALPTTATGSTISVSAGATNLGPHVFTVSFATAPGIANETMTGTASSVELQSGGTAGANYTGSDASKGVVAKSLPAIGTFSY
ncbi:hypothetical protein [Draconibacterium sp.]|uniref:hypothetical protein n=1 Tax=Draconibacterium sp. TaxID=1965318 RepID=UPI003568A313